MTDKYFFGRLLRAEALKKIDISLFLAKSQNVGG